MRLKEKRRSLINKFELNKHHKKSINTSLGRYDD
jgi:hypothetical protein